MELIFHRAPILIDIAYGLGDIQGFVDEITSGKPLFVVNTHDHFDHAYGNSRFDKVYCHEYLVPYLEMTFNGCMEVDMLKNRKHDHLGLATYDIEATVNWYINVLGFELAGDFVAPDGTKCKFVKNMDITYEIFQPIDGMKAEVAGKIDHFAFQSRDIEADYNFCVKQGYVVTTKGIETIPTFWSNGCRYFKIASPTGEEIEFCEII